MPRHLRVPVAFFSATHPSMPPFVPLLDGRLFSHIEEVRRSTTDAARDALQEL